MPQQLATHIVELGRLRIGAIVPIKSGSNAGKPRPTSLEHWRLTSNNHAALTVAAKRYGGEVRPWQYPPDWLGLKQIRKPDHRYELLTETATLDVILHGEGLMTTDFEIWEGPYCTRRCDGTFIVKCGYGKMQGLECQCPSDPQERRRLAQEGKACEAVSRITVILPGMSLGQWRLDTRGFYAPAEIRGLQYFLRCASMGNVALEGVLRLEQRVDQKMVNGKGQTFNYPVVVVEPRAPAEALLLAGEARKQLLEASRGNATPDARPLLERAATATDELFGDGASANMRATAASQALPRVTERAPRAYTVTEHGTISTQPPGKLAIEMQITDLLYAQGRDDAGVAAWWQEQRSEMEDISPGYLNYLYEQLQGMPVQIQPAQPPATRTDAEELVAAWRALAQAREALGWTEEETKIWERKQARRFRKTYSQLSAETVRGLVAELGARWVSLHAMPGSAPETTQLVASVPVEETERSAATSAEPMPPEPSPEPPGGYAPDECASVRDDLAWFVQGLEDTRLKADALALLEDAEASLEALAAMRDTVQRRLANERQDVEDVERDLPF